MRQIFSCLGKLGGTTNFNSNTVALWPSSVSIFNGLIDFRKFDNFSHFFMITAENRCSDFPKSGKDASR